MDPQRPSSSGCEPAGMPKIEMVVSWYGERTMVSASFVCGLWVFLFPCWWALRAIKSPVAVARRRRRPGRKGTGSDERRKLFRDCGSVLVQNHAAGDQGAGALVGVSGSAVDCAPYSPAYVT